MMSNFTPNVVHGLARWRAASHCLMRLNDAWIKGLRHFDEGAGEVRAMRVDYFLHYVR